MDTCRTTAPAWPLCRRLEGWITSPIAGGIFLVLGLAALFRQYLFAHSYWYDEAFLILPIRERSYADLLGPQPYNLVIPPLFLWLTRALYELGGDGELILRLPAFAAGVAALLVMIPLARHLVGRPHALWAFAWLAVSRHLIEHSCDVRPYTLDLLLTEVILLCAAVLLEPATGRCVRGWALAGLGICAVLGPWLSFPSAFVLGGTSMALGLHLWRQGNRAGWRLWLGFNGLLVLSGAALWWLSGRHMYYPGMIEHWGHEGWWGFPDWQSPADIGRWLLWRPYDIGNYGNREVGIFLAALAVVGAVALAKRRRALTVLLLGPFVLALAAALLGKYPLAHRTAFFLLPCLWLCAAIGFGTLVDWARRRGCQLTLAGLLLVAWDFFWLVVAVAAPEARADYRGAYQFVHAHRRAEDMIWSQMAVVYQTYYGKNALILKDEDFAEVERLVARRRLWAVIHTARYDLRQRLEAAGGRVVYSHNVSGLCVLLFEPQCQVARATE